MGQVIPIAEQFLGMETRPGVATPGHAKLSLNCQVRDGAITPRPGFVDVQSTYATYGNLLKFTDPSGDTRFVVVGPFDLGGVVGLSDGRIGQPYDVTLALPGEPRSGTDWSCTLIETYINGDKSILIVSPVTTYIYNTYARTIRVANSASDSPKSLLQSGPYWATVPYGFAAQHANMTFYAGFRAGASVALDSNLDPDQALIPEHWVGDNRGEYAMQPHMMAYSDPGDPVGLFTSSVLSTDGIGKITGLSRFGRKLLVFTETAIYSLRGDPFLLAQGQSSFTRFSEYGCVDPGSLQVTPAGVFYRSDGGIRLTDGESSVAVEGLGFLWKSDPFTRVPAAATAALAQVKYPWKATPGGTRTLHRQRHSEVWFQVHAGNGHVCLVYNYAQKTASVYCRDDLGMMFGDYMEHDGREYVTRDNRIEEIIDGRMDDGATFPQVYISQKFLQSNSERTDFRRLRLTLRAEGNVTAGWMMEGQHGAFDEELDGVDNADQQATNGALDLHPHMQNNYFLGSMVLGSDKLSSKDLFVARIDPDPVLDKWLVWGFVDWPPGRPPMVSMYGASVEVHTNGGKR